MKLTDWTLIFAKYRHMMKGELENVEQKDNIIHVTCKKNMVHDYFIFEKLENITPFLSAAKESDTIATYSVILVCLNTKENLKILFELWQQLIVHQRLTVYFVNPDAKEEKKWVVKPWLHHRISDPESLNQGIKAMFETVEEVA